MNKKEVVSLMKKELYEGEITEQLLKQSLEGVTRRNYTLKVELEKLGASTPKPKPSIITQKQRLELIANLTK